MVGMVVCIMAGGTIENTLPDVVLTRPSFC